MNFNRLPCFIVIALSLAATVTAQTGPDAVPSRVLTATLPIPMPDRADHPLPPDRLRAESPWTLSLAGAWHFRLTQGQIVDGHFALSDAAAAGIRVSSAEGSNVAMNAFDGNPETRWCASLGTFPQSIQVRLDAPHTVTSVDIAWERSTANYTCRIEGGEDGVHWRTLLDRSAAPGIGDGPLTLPASDAMVRFVRVVVVGASKASWASIRELKIHYRNDGQDVVWHPAPPAPTVPAHADDFVATDFKDNGWDMVTVPSNWEMAGYSMPTYNSVDDSVGLYRRWVTIPASCAVTIR